MMLLERAVKALRQLREHLLSHLAVPRELLQEHLPQLGDVHQHLIVRVVLRGQLVLHALGALVEQGGRGVDSDLVVLALQFLNEAVQRLLQLLVLLTVLRVRPENPQLEPAETLLLQAHAPRKQNPRLHGQLRDHMLLQPLEELHHDVLADALVLLDVHVAQHGPGLLQLDLTMGVEVRNQQLEVGDEHAPVQLQLPLRMCEGVLVHGDLQLVQPLTEERIQQMVGNGGEAWLPQRRVGADEASGRALPHVSLHNFGIGRRQQRCENALQRVLRVGSRRVLKRVKRGRGQDRRGQRVVLAF
ncbi:chromosome partitioning protein ParB [Babesia caballi]|uniref:Chromosome partitioning protein ParB n=1 Tax=Babesia caballi TaxID=5871 RepID=A0AAV4LRM6_BABCB|nr:chromosome partitioning protein ParB [Babesia caballi]